MNIIIWDVATSKLSDLRFKIKDLLERTTKDAG